MGIAHLLLGHQALEACIMHVNTRVSEKKQMRRVKCLCAVARVDLEKRQIRKPLLCSLCHVRMMMGSERKWTRLATASCAVILVGLKKQYIATTASNRLRKPPAATRTESQYYPNQCCRDYMALDRWT